MAEDRIESFFEPWDQREVPVRDVREEVARISAANPPSEESVAGFLDHRRHLVQDVDITGESIRISALVPPPRGIGVGVYMKTNILDFEKATVMYWWIVAPQYLGGPSNSLVYLTSSNVAARGCEALVEYKDHLPAVFRIWDWSTRPQPNGSRFVVNIPFADWGDRYLQATIDGQKYGALYVANGTLKTGEPDQWRNDVLVYDAKAGGFNHEWGHPYNWTPEPSIYFGWGPIVEPFKPYDFGTTNPVGFAKARLVTDKVDAILVPQNSKIVRRPVGFEPFAGTPNHTLLAQ